MRQNAPRLAAFFEKSPTRFINSEHAPEGAGRFARHPEQPQTHLKQKTQHWRLLGADVQTAVSGAAKNAALRALENQTLPPAKGVFIRAA